MRVTTGMPAAAKRARSGTICRSSTGTNTTASGTAASASPTSLLLADVVGRLGHKVRGPRAGFGGDPVGGQAGRGIGGIDPVLGEDSEGEGRGMVPILPDPQPVVSRRMAKPYDQIPDRRAIVRRRVLEDALALVEDLPTGAEPPRPAVLALLRDALAVGRAEIRRRFEEPGPLRNDGDQVLAATSFLMDQLIRVIFDFATSASIPPPIPVPPSGWAWWRPAATAAASWRRCRTSICCSCGPTSRRRAASRSSSSCSTCCGTWASRSAMRTVDESLRYGERDQTIRTAPRSALRVGRSRAVRRADQGLRQKFLTGDGRDFVEAKLAERDQRHQRMGDSRYVVEPNVKEGKGGLRDLHLLFWIAEYLYRVHEPSELVAKGVLTKEEARHFERAERFFDGALPHPLSDRPRRRRLSFELQREIAARLGYQDRPGSRGVERFTKHYYLHAKTVGDLTRIFVAALEDSRRRKPKLRRLVADACGRASSRASALTASGWRSPLPDAFTKDPVAILRLFHVAQENDLDIHPATLRLITQNIRLVDRLRTPIPRPTGCSWK